MDVVLIAKWSVAKFGPLAARRYRLLIRQALDDIGSDPERPGSKEVASSFEGVRAYHLALSRDHVQGQRVKSPRHFVIYRRSGEDTVSVARILHDSVDLPRHLSRLEA